MGKRQLTPAERALIERIATMTSLGAFSATRLRMVVGDEVDEHGRVQWTTTVALSDLLPNA